MDPATQRRMNPKKDKENTEPAREAGKLAAQLAHKTRKASVNAHSSKAGKKEALGSSAKITKSQNEQKETKVELAAQPSNGKRQTLSQAFLSQQAVRQKKLVAEVAKPQATGPPKPVPGTFKGRVIQSKVSSFWKPTGGAAESEAKGSTKHTAPKTEAPKRQRAMSTAVVPPGPSVQKIHSALPPRPKSVPHRPPQQTANKLMGTTAMKHTAPKVQRPAPSSKPFPNGAAADATVGPVSGKGPNIPKRKEPLPSAKSRHPVVAVTEKKAPKPPATSSLSQYRVSKETAEERRAKLAEWLAAKGKTLKRPPAVSGPLVTSRPASKPQSKPGADSQPHSSTQPDSNLEPQPLAQAGLETKPITESQPGMADSPNLMTTTLDLLESSDMELPEVQMDDLVINLCSAMDAMEVVSASDTKFGGGENSSDDVKESKAEEQVEMVVNGGEDGGEEDVSERKGEEVEEEESGDRVTETPCKEMEGATVVKYSVRTTPYLQSVRRKIQEEVAPGSATRRQSAIKDLKFLTPVRRSCRIQQQSARLPAMVVEHDPCVASLAELVQLDGRDGDTSAYVYRRNPALLDSLSDQPMEAGL